MGGRKNTYRFVYKAVAVAVKFIETKKAVILKVETKKVL